MYSLSLLLSPPPFLSHTRALIELWCDYIVFNRQNYSDIIKHAKGTKKCAALPHPLPHHKLITLSSIRLINKILTADGAENELSAYRWKNGLIIYAST